MDDATLPSPHRLKLPTYILIPVVERWKSSCSISIKMYSNSKRNQTSRLPVAM